MITDQHGDLYKSAPALQEVLSHYYHIYNPAGTNSVTKHLSPNLEMILVLNFGPPIPFSFGSEPPGTYHLEQITAAGPLRKMLNYSLPPGADAIVLNFHLNGFYRVFPTPLDQYEGAVIPITLPYIQELWQEVKSAGVQQRIDLLNDYLLSLVMESEPASKPLIAGKNYFHDPVIQPAKAIAANASLSERTVQLRFQKYTGYSPKELLRFLRFKAVINTIISQKENKPDVFDLIETFGYHDQSHLIKDFRLYLDTTPQQFIKALKDDNFFVAGSGRDKNQDLK
ncbi:AraC family transcriptional regulator [Chitinophaga sp. sic0106]|uniref:AraC family transcriptional regulator n=1 Tax=Chitinophaga sp. sic0106 TaxID=2854785 RepID=UPI001C47D08F|nr:helix-turn-helix domain-containing protein [Chitinophaga sp. sic0106]MBV7532344.1 helix-turn-helix domain-containing protein [Chitinophaga sp. sic0106]